MADRPKRKAIPERVKREVTKRQGRKCLCGCGTRCWGIGKWDVQWDHDPALRLRDINEDGSDYIPPQLDPAYIVGRCRESHKSKTHGTGATTAGTDTGKIKKERKRARPAKAKRKIPSRPFTKVPPGYVSPLSRRKRK